MSIGHKDIPDAQLHEPKGIVSAITKAVYRATGTGTGVWARLTQSDLDFSDKTKNRTGWNDVSDNQYTSGSPRALTSGARVQLTNNTLGTQTDVSRLGALWASNQLSINDLNAAYSIRINFKATAAAAAGTPYVVLIELQSDNGSTVISGTTQFIKGGGYINQVSITIPFYMGSFVNNQPLKLFVTPDTAMNIYDIGFVLQRNYVET